MKSTYKTFETERLFLRPTDIEDAAFVLELMNTPKWLKNVGNRNLQSIQDAENYIKTKMRPQLERLGYSNYSVIRKSDNCILGSCGLYDREGLEGIDIGFAFLPQYENQGYAFESSNKIKEVAIQEFKLTEINAITIKENVGSIKLLTKLGFKFTKIIHLPNDPEDLLFYQFKV